MNGNYRFSNLAAGTYVVRIEISTLPRGSTQTYDLDGLGTAHGASRTVAVSQDATDVDFGYRSTASVGDFVWLDANADGVQDGGETGINGVRVYLDMNGNGVFDSADRTLGDHCRQWCLYDQRLGCRCLYRTGGHQHPACGNDHHL